MEKKQMQENLCADCDSYKQVKAERDELAAVLERLLDTPEPMTTIEHFDYSANAIRLARAALAKKETK